MSYGNRVSEMRERHERQWQRHERNTRRATMLGCGAAIVLVPLMLVAIVAVLWAAWEYVVREFWAGAPALTFWQVGLAVLAVSVAATLLGGLFGRR
jgi:hypothetical protein